MHLISYQVFLSSLHKRYPKHSFIHATEQQPVEEVVGEKLGIWGLLAPAACGVMPRMFWMWKSTGEWMLSEMQKLLQQSMAARITVWVTQSNSKGVACKCHFGERKGKGTSWIILVVLSSNSRTSGKIMKKKKCQSLLCKDHVHCRIITLHSILITFK